MAKLALDLSRNEDSLRYEQEVQLIRGVNTRECFVLIRGQLLASYETSDLYTRNFVIVQLFLNHKVKQQVLSTVFELTVPHISRMVKKFREQGSAGIVANLEGRTKNNHRIKGKIADDLEKLLTQEDCPTYDEAAQWVKKRFGIKVSGGRIGNWWRVEKKIWIELEKDSKELTLQLALINEEISTREENDMGVVDAFNECKEQQVDEGEWRYNIFAGCFILYGMLWKSQFLKPFIEGIQGTIYQGKKSVGRVMLTLFFGHALRLKSIEQTKHLLGEHFKVLVRGGFYRQQSLRYAIDDLVGHEKFESTVSAHYKNLSQQTELGDEIYYTDGHFSCYYGKYKIPKGYDARRKQPSRGRNSVYLHNSLGHHILSFESPTNTTLNVDIKTLINKMKEAYGCVSSKTLFFDRGGFSAECFKNITRQGMLFATYLKHVKKGAEVALELFAEVAVDINGETIKNWVYEKERTTKHYGLVRTLLFIGKQGKQIPIITTNLELSAAEIIARMQKRWIEENGFKYMGEHFNIDMLTTYKTEEAPDKIIERPNKRKEINGKISNKKQALTALKDQYTNRINDIKEKDKITIAEFEKREETLKFEMKNFEMEIGLLKLEKKDVPTKVKSNLKDECVISQQKRRLFINLIKCMNYNSEKWLQDLFCKYHPKKDETLSLIRQVLKTPGRVRQQGGVVEVELERLDSESQATSIRLFEVTRWTQIGY